MSVKVYLLGTDRSRFPRVQALLQDTEFEILGQSDRLQDFFSTIARGAMPQLVIVLDSEQYRSNPRTVELLTVAAYIDEIPVLLAGPAPRPEAIEGLLKLLSDDVIDGYLLTDQPQDLFVASLNLATLHGKVVPSDFFKAMHGPPPAEHAAEGRQPVALSERELQILKCLVDGETNKEIANELDIAEGTVKVHMKTLLLKIKAVNRTQAAIWAMRHGIGLK